MRLSHKYEVEQEELKKQMFDLKNKVERQHRIDEARFYKKMRMYSLEDGRKQLERYNARSNDIPKICLNFRSPNEVLAEYLAIM